MKELQKNENMIFLQENRKSGPVETRINPEISRAIKRQKETNGVEYWKTSPTPKGTFSSGGQKRSTFDKMHHLKFEFPNGLLPAIPTPSPRLQPTKSCQLPKGSRKKGLPTGLETLNRSYSSTCMTIPTVKDLGGHISPKKASVTDLTCLQLADTLFSHPDQMSTGLNGFPVGRIRYMDYIVDSLRARDDIDKENNNQEPFPVVKSQIREDKVLALSPKTGNQDQIWDLKTGESVLSVDKHNSRKVFNGKCDSPVEIFEPGFRENEIDAVDNTKSVKRRSILKPSKPNIPAKDYPLTQKEINISNSGSKMCNESSNSKITKPSTSLYKHDIPPFDPSQCITITSHPSRGGNGLTGCGINVMTTNKHGYHTPNRSVRFSVSDEIHEYMPSEPICY